jgi:ParD-like antitoxin of type II ParDE toxin-antitoxin system
MTVDKPTRVATDLLESAAIEGARQSRSAKQQLDHWTRVGRSVSMRDVVVQRRIEAALAGTLALSELAPHERGVVNAELDAAIEGHARTASYADLLAADGITTVALDVDGNLVERRPDGTTTTIG